MVERVADWLARLVDIAVGVLLSVIVVITLAQVVARYGLGSSLIWSEEFNRLLYVWMILLAAVKASHMRITLFAEKLGPGPGRLVEIFSTLLQLGLLGLILYGALEMYQLTSTDSFIGLKLSVKYMFLAPIVGAVLWGVAVVARAVRVRPDEDPTP